MSENEEQPGPPGTTASPFGWEPTPSTPPIRVRAKRWKQAGYDVYSAPCPQCQPNMSADAPVVQQRIHLNDQGRIICSCGAYLELYYEEEAK